MRGRCLTPSAVMCDIGWGTVNYNRKPPRSLLPKLGPQPELWPLFCPQQIHKHYEAST